MNINQAPETRSLPPLTPNRERMTATTACSAWTRWAATGWCGAASAKALARSALPTAGRHARIKA